MPQFITAAAGSAHITPLQDSMIWRGITGSESVVFDRFNKFAPEISTSTQIRISSGIAMIQGRFFCIEPGATDTVNIGAGQQGRKRIDIVCAKVTVGSTTQSLAWEVIQGNPATDNPQRPTVVIGDLDAGDTTARMPMVQVNIDGITIESVEMIADVADPMEALISKTVTKAAVAGKGSATRPIYFDSGGTIREATYTLAKSVPSNAKFTDTTALTSMTGILPVAKGGTESNNAAGARVNLGLQNIVKIGIVTGESTSIGANSSKVFTINATMAGYTPIGVIGFSTGDISIFPASLYFNDAAGYVYANLKNTSSTAHTVAPQFFILFAKDL